ncbi:DinB family protein, partial [Candidatus Bipolaricaulota bacterium]|nr:DinB family protein [Candidatus Bipolaricaulota bacterium]
MNSTAKAYRSGLERSNAFIETFTKGMEGDDWLQRPAGFPNPAIWILGHLAHSRAGFLEMLTGTKSHEEGWEDLFEMGVDSQDPSVYPSVDTCRAVLDARLQDLKAYLETATEVDLEAPACVGSGFFKSKGAVISFLTHHEAHHTGALSMIRRA